MYRGWRNKETFLAYHYLLNEDYDWISYAEKAHLLDLTAALEDEIKSLFNWLPKYDDELYWAILDWLDSKIVWEDLAEAFEVLADKQANREYEEDFEDDEEWEEEAD